MNSSTADRDTPRRSLMLVSSFLLLWLAIVGSEQFQSALAYVGILSIGILHGANDLKVLLRLKGEESNVSGLRFLGLYVALVLAVLIVFILLPSIALPVFILVSSYHFGEQHFSELKGPRMTWRTLLRLGYGLFIFSTLFWTNASLAAQIMSEIADVVVSPVWFQYGFHASLILLVSGTAGCYSSLLKQYRVVEELFLLLLFPILFSTAGLLLGFAIYFVVWHSYPSLLEQLDYLYQDTSRKAAWRYVRESALYWIAAIVGLGLLLYFFMDRTDELLAIVVVFLAAITVPHSLIMWRVLHRD